MTPEQFDALAVLMGQTSRTVKSASSTAWCWWKAFPAPRLPARQHHDAGANQAVQRCRRVIELAKVVVR